MFLMNFVMDESDSCGDFCGDSCGCSMCVLAVLSCVLVVTDVSVSPSSVGVLGEVHTGPRYLRRVRNATSIILARPFSLASGELLILFHGC